MTEPRNRIQILDPGSLLALAEHETKEGRRAAFADALLRLIELQARYITSGTQRDTDVGVFRIGTIWPSDRDLTEVNWTIRQDPNQTSGLHGLHILTGGLVRHVSSDGTWGIHT